MKFNLTSPCSNCPFLKEPYFYLMPGRRKEIADSLLKDSVLKDDYLFPCHKTTDGETVEDEEGEEIYIPSDNEQQCAGAVIVMIKSGRIWDNFWFRLAAQRKLFFPEKFNLKAPVYSSMEEFVNDER